MTTGELSWFKSSYSSGGDGDCVEVAITPATIHVRDSKNRRGPHLALSREVWAGFAAYVRTSGTSSTPCGRSC
ncbi:DUF397 domain-containing protein [Streptomyces sp. NPDC002144]|uniref:DUF397 domain-containing protein n=1 Tax=Streptomyces griseorubiginosus TaxID=67304 RepID=UPI0010564CE6|nr:DUF397 domain-containing protein [Streptomyces griseorubiginosus]MBO4257830.1 DUF397 domain-containing protein [Streptomyces griseorubiginosus]